jgi:hypothetical protein
MTTNTTKMARVNSIDALQKLVNGYTKYTATAPSVVLAGATLKPTDIVAKLQALITTENAVTSAAAAWHSQVTTQRAVVLQARPLLLALRQSLQSAYSAQLDVLADFGLTPRKKAVVSPDTRAAAALKAKATRAARGTTGKKVKAAITAPVVITPASATPIKSVTTAVGSTASTPTGAATPTTSGTSTAASTPSGAATTSGSPTPPAAPAPVTHS